MLEPMELLPGARRALRRSVCFDCDVVSTHWDEALPHRVRDLSPYGLWIDTQFPLCMGEEVVVSFTPPRWHRAREIVVFGEVTRAVVSRRRGDARSSGMGIQFLDLSRYEMRALDSSLRGLPPPLPRASVTPRYGRELVWIDMPVVVEEDLGGAVGVFEVSDLLGEVSDDELSIQPLGELLTGGISAAVPMLRHVA